jgi:hypothetical protein
LIQIFYLLTYEELRLLVSSCHRDDYQPALKAFLLASRNLNMLRCLAFPPDDKPWTAPQFYEEKRDGV